MACAIFGQGRAMERINQVKAVPRMKIKVTDPRGSFTVGEY